jgi:Ala-tRNA(Pro) deacylase
MNIITFLESNHCPFECFPHEPTFSAERLAQAIKVRDSEVAKTVLLRVGDGCRYAVAVLPASKKLDLKAASALLGGAPVHLATEFEIAERCPECDFGVLPPFGSRYGMQTIVDTSLVEDEDIFFDAQTHCEAIRMTFDDYRELEEPLIGRFAVSN